MIGVRYGEAMKQKDTDTTTIRIDMEKRCRACGKKGAMESGICMKCAAQRLRNAAGSANAEKFQHSDEVELIAKTLVADNHEHLRVAAIAYLMKKLDPDKEAKLPKRREGKKGAMARAISTPQLWHALCGFDFVLVVDELYWRLLGPEQKVALVDHELCHFALDEDGWYVRDHDVEEFKAILERHGFWRQDLQDFVLAAPIQRELPLDKTEQKETRIH
jgi:hypothetical protein